MAYYGYVGVAQSIDLQDGIINVIGGGSTEITLVRKRKMAESHSFPSGAVNLNEAFTKSDRVTNEQINQLRTYLFSHLQTLSWLHEVELPVIGIGGSAKNLFRMHQGKSRKNL